MIEGELVRLENALLEATQRRDMPVLERMLGDEFTLTTGRPGHEIRDRSEWLEITRSQYAISSFSFDWIEARVYGETAVVRSRYAQNASMGGEDRSASYLMTDVWVWREARWQIVTRHITPLTAPPEEGESV